VNAPDARARLADLMDARRRDLRLTWDEVASQAGIHRETLRQIRAGTGAIRPLSATGIEDALEWERGSIEALLRGEIDREHGRGSFVKAVPPLPENLAALIGSTDSTAPRGGDLASILGRLNEVSEQLQQITADVTVHGVATGRDAIRVIGEYGLAWSQLADGIRRAAEQGGLVDPRQLLDVMQELHDRYGLQTRPPKDHPEDPTKETTDG
jgi:hypothetical protein